MSINYIEYPSVYAACVYDELRKSVNYIICTNFDDTEGKLVAFLNWTFIETNHRFIEYSAYDLTNPSDSVNLPNAWSNRRMSKVLSSGVEGEYLFVNPNQIRFIKRITPEQAAFITSTSLDD